MEKSKIKSATKKVSKVPRGKVYYEQGFTYNRGNFNSEKISIGVELPLNPTDADLCEAKKTLQICKSIVEKELLPELTEFQFMKAIEALKNGQCTISKIEKKYKIPEKYKDELIESEKNYNEELTDENDAINHSQAWLNEE
jgi:hypothetical protein